MEESDWHKKVQKEIFHKHETNGYSSHDRRLYLYKDGSEERNCLSDADIIVKDPSFGEISKIIEIETALNPKKIMGILMVTHVCNICKIDKEYPLRNITLEIIIRKAPPTSEKDKKLEIILPILNEFIHYRKGSISKLEIDSYPRE